MDGLSEYALDPRWQALAGVALAALFRLVPESWTFVRNVLFWPFRMIGRAYGWYREKYPSNATVRARSEAANCQRHDDVLTLCGSLGTKIEEIAVAVSNIAQQVHPNGSGSMNDSLNRVEKIVCLLPRQIRRVLAHQQSYADHRGEASYQCAADGKWEWVARATADIFGVERVKLIDDRWLQMVVSSQRPRLRQAREDGIKAKADWREQVSIDLPNGECICVEISAVALLDTDGELVGWDGRVWQCPPDQTDMADLP